MPEDIRALSAELARDPESLVFLRLGEALRRRDQLDAAQRVARAGLERHPHLADAHDLLARIHSDRYDFERAFEEWDAVLRIAPEHPGAHKGLGFLYFRVGDLANALAHLETAAALQPEDQSIQQALQTVRSFAEEQSGSLAGASQAALDRGGAPTEAEFIAGLGGADRSMVLLDQRGRTLGGALRGHGGRDVTETAAALLAGVSQECERTSRLLDFGEWRGLSAEAESGHLHVARPTDQTLLLVLRDKSVPLGRIAFIAERAANAARRWLDRQ